MRRMERAKLQPAAAAACHRILADRGDGLVVTGLRSSTYDCAAVRLTIPNNSLSLGRHGQRALL